MKSIRYSRYTGDDFGISAEDLLRALSDFFLQSGFDNPYMQFSEWNHNTLEDLKRAIEQALERGEFFDQERAEQIRQKLESMSQEELDQLLNRLVQKLVDEGYIDTEQPQGGGRGKGDARVEVKVTDVEACRATVPPRASPHLAGIAGGPVQPPQSAFP